MVYTSKQKTIIYIDRGGIFFFDSQTEQLVRFNFQPVFYHDLEIVNIEELQKQLTQFMQASKLQPSLVSLILSADFLFEATVVHDGKTILEEEKEKFIDAVPFEQVSIKVFPGEKEDLIVATNKTLYLVVIRILEMNTFQVKEVLPGTLLVKDLPSLSQGFNVSVAKSLLGAHDKYKIYDLREQVGVESAESMSAQPKSKFRTVHILIIVFVLLICILAYLLLKPQDPVPVSNAPVAVTTPVVIPSVPLSPTETVKVSSPAAGINISSIKVQIAATAEHTVQSEEITRNLNALGVSSIEVKTDSSLTQSKTLVIMKQSVPQDIKDKIITEIKKTYPDLSLQESPETSYDVIVNLSNL